MINNNFEELAKWTAEYCKKNGADDCTVYVGFGRGISIEFRDSKIEKLEESQSKSLSLSIYVNNKFSSHSTNDLRKDELEKFINEAIASTKYLSPDQFRKLPDPKYYPKDFNINLNLVDNSFYQIDTAQRVKLATEAEEAAMGVSNKIISSTSSYGDSFNEFVLVQSNGFIGKGSGTNFSISAEVTVNDNDKGRPEDYAYGSTRFFKELPNPADIGKEAAKRALNKIGQTKINSGKYVMVVENRTAGRLIGLLTGPMSARAIQQKSSWLDGMLGKQIASEKLTIVDNPFIEKGFSSRIFDGEGIAMKKKTVIDKGKLQQYYIDNYYGRKLGWEPNSGSVTNLILDLGTRNEKEIVKDIKNGIYVNGFIGGNSNSTTGDFSFGIVGQLIENGEFTKPINEMNISGNAKEFWSSLVELGNDPFPYSSWKTPTLVFENINFSGK